MKSIMKSLNLSRYNEIKIKIIETCKTESSCPLIYICSHSIYTVLFPDRLKISIVKLLHKKLIKLLWKITGPIHY